MACTYDLSWQARIVSASLRKYVTASLFLGEIGPVH